MTFKKYVNPLSTELFPNMRRLKGGGGGGGAKKTFQVNFGVSRFTLEWSHCTLKNVGVHQISFYQPNA